MYDIDYFKLINKVEEKGKFFFWYKGNMLVIMDLGGGCSYGLFMC